MPILDFLDKWDIKKHGFTGLAVAICFTCYELFAPKDATCTQEVRYLQTECSVYRDALLESNRKLNNIQKIDKQKDSTLKVKAIIPAAAIIKNKENEN